MTPQLWFVLAGMAGSTFVAGVTLAWYLAGRLGKQDTKIAVIEVVTDLTRTDVAFLRRAKEEEMGRKRDRAHGTARDRGWGVIEGGHGDNGEGE